MANHPCPNVNLDSWKELVEKVGIFEAYKAFRNNGYEIPDPKSYQQKEASSELPNEQLDAIIKKNFQRLGFNTKNIPDGDFAGRVDTLKKVAEVVDGKAGIDTWAHEYTHVVLDLLPDSSPILKEIMKDVMTRPEYADIYEQYEKDPEYLISTLTDKEKERLSELEDKIVPTHDYLSDIKKKDTVLLQGTGENFYVTYAIVKDGDSKVYLAFPEGQSPIEIDQSVIDAGIKDGMEPMTSEEKERFVKSYGEIEYLEKISKGSFMMTPEEKSDLRRLHAKNRKKVVDEEKMAKEAASHIIDDIIVGKFKEKAALKWWQKLWNWIKSKFSDKNLDAYEQVAEDVLSGYAGRLDKNKVGKGRYKQIPQDVAAKMARERAKLKKEIVEYTKAIRDKTSTSTEQKAVIEGTILKEITPEVTALGLKPSPKVDLEDATHIYKDENGIVYDSTTRKITGEFSEDKAAQYELNKDIGNDIDTLLTAATLGKSFDEIKKITTPTLSDDYKYRIYSDQLRFVEQVISNGEIAIPQVIVSDPVSKTAGSIDLLVIDAAGNERVYDWKTSVNEVKEGKSDTYTSEWQQNPGSVFNGLTYKDGQLVPRGIGDDPVRLSKKAQHGIQTGTYGRMRELQGSPVVGTYSRHMNVELDHVNWKLKSYKDEGLISHGIEDNKPYIDQVVPTQVDENNLSELQKNREGYDIVDTDPPTPEEKKEAKEEFSEPLQETPEIKGLGNKIHEFLGQRVEHMKRLLRDKPDDVHIIKKGELEYLDTVRDIVGASIDSKSYSSLFETYMNYTINQAKNTANYLKDKATMFTKDGKLNPHYTQITQRAFDFLEGYRDIQRMAASIPDIQIPKFEQMSKALNQMEDAISKGNREYMIEHTLAQGFQFNRKEVEDAFDGAAKDISVLSRLFNAASATDSVLISAFFDIIRKAVFTAREQAKEDNTILDKGLKELKSISKGVPDEKLCDYMINRGDMTFVQRIGRQYEDRKQAAKDALIDPTTGERHEPKLGDSDKILQYNKDLYDKIFAYSELTQAEKWMPAEWDPTTKTVIADGYYEEGEYMEYAPLKVYDSEGNVIKTLDFVAQREIFEEKDYKGKWKPLYSADSAAKAGIKWREEKGKFYEVNNDNTIGRQLSTNEVKNIGALQYRNTFKMQVPDLFTPQYKDGKFTGKVIANPEGTMKWVVKSEYKQVRDKSVSGTDLRDPKWRDIMKDNSPQGTVRRTFYNDYMGLRHRLSLKLPKAQRKNFMTYLDAIDIDTLGEAVRTGGVKKVAKKWAKNIEEFADVYSNPAREVEIDEKGDVVIGVPLPIIGRYNGKRVKELTAELAAATDPNEKRKLKKLLKREQSKVRTSDISTDIIQNTKKIADAIREYDNMSKAESNLLALQQIAGSHILQKKLPMTDAEGQNIFVKSLKGATDKIAATFSNGGHSNIADKMRDMFAMIVHKNVPYKDTTASKIEGRLITLLSFRYFAFNPPIALMGRMGNRLLVTWPEGVIGQYFTKKQAIKFEGIIQIALMLGAKNRAMRLAGGGIKAASKLEAMGAKYQVHPGSHFSDKTLKGSPQHLMEWTSLMSYFGPMANNTPIKGKDGTISNLWDIETFDEETGELIIDNNFKEEFEKGNYKYKLFTKVFDFQNRFEGVYNILERASVTQYMGGISGMFLHKHFPAIVQRMLAAPWIHSNLGYSEGAYYMAGRLIKEVKEFEGSFREKAQMGYREAIPKGAVGNKGYWKMNEEERKKADDKAYADDKEFRDKDGNIDEEKIERDRQKRRETLGNMKRILVHMTSICAFTGAYMWFKAMAEDDDPEERRWNNYLARTFDKLRKQQMFVIPVLGSEEQYQLIKSPFASLRVIGDLADTMGDALGLAIPGVESRYTTGTHAGELKAWVKAKKQIPFVNLPVWWEELKDTPNYMRK